MWDQRQGTPSSGSDHPSYIVIIDDREKQRDTASGLGYEHLSGNANSQERSGTTLGLKYENLSGAVSQDRPDTTSGLKYENMSGVVSQDRPDTTSGLKYENMSGVVSHDTPARISYQDCLSDIGGQDDRELGEEYAIISDVVRRDNPDRASGEEYAMISDMDSNLKPDRTSDQEYALISDIDSDVKPDNTSGDEYDTIPDIIRHDKSNRTRCIPPEVMKMFPTKYFENESNYEVMLLFSGSIAYRVYLQFRIVHINYI